jgi:uncharacterized protein
MSNANVQTIQTIYGAFARGDVPAILALCTPEAEFAFEGGTPAVPWHGPWRGHAAIGRFFGVLAETVDFQAFEPRDFAASASAVAVLVRLRYQVRSTGKVVDELQVHWWSMREGKVTALRHHEDTAQVIAAAAA